MIYELHLDGTPENRRVIHLLAELFDLEPEQIQILNTHEELIGKEQATVFVVPRRRPAGEFALSLEIIDDSSSGHSEEDVALAFARHFRCSCLVTDNSLDPNLWTLVTSEGDLYPADVDPDALERDELRVIHIRHGE